MNTVYFHGRKLYVKTTTSEKYVEVIGENGSTFWLSPKQYKRFSPINNIIYDFIVLLIKKVFKL